MFKHSLLYTLIIDRSVISVYDRSVADQCLISRYRCCDRYSIVTEQSKRKQSGTAASRRSLNDHSSITPDRTRAAVCPDPSARSGVHAPGEHFFLFSGELTFRLISFILSCLLLSSSRDIPLINRSLISRWSITCRSPIDPADCSGL